MASSAVHKFDEIVVFDFDGTITTADTFALFLRYYAGTLRWALHLLCLSPVFLAYILRVVSRNYVKSRVISKFFTGQSVEAVQKAADKFAREVIPGLIRPKAAEALELALKRQKDGLEGLYICSASIGPYLRAYFGPLGVSNILATEMEAMDGVYTGRIAGWNIWGEGKVRRIKAEFEPHKVLIKEAYGDSRGDRELLNAAQASFFRPFRL
ncbi:MAG: HAD-IB family phosphatase [Maricaulaceae bacterium]